LKYRRMPIEVESPEQLGYGRIRNNLAESSFSDMSLGELGVKLDDVVLQYHDHLGHPGLRGLISAHSGVAEDEVIVTVGAAAALFIVATSLLDKDDHLVVMRPNYATNLETPRAIGCAIDYLDLRYEDRWALDLDELARLLTPRTRLISLTCPHNPTGTVLDEATLRGALALAERHGCRILVDETYREMTFGPMLPCAASLSPAAISVGSLSKAYGLPGIRLGWLISRDPSLRETFLAAKEQIFICNSIVDEEIGYQALAQRERLLSRIRPQIMAAFEATRRFFQAHPELEWIEPSGGVVGFARLRADVAARTDMDRFYRVLLERHGTMVGPGHWFEQPRHYMRIGYGWPKLAELEDGLASIERSLGEANTPA
jgi:aspartate/methionine/tyrosine aminotransferase